MTIFSSIRSVPVWTVALLVVVSAFVAALFAPALAAENDKPTIVLVGARSSIPQGQHDWPDGLVMIQRLIAGSPEFKAAGATVKFFPAGFPADLSQIDDADTIVTYFGPENGVNPVEKPAVRQKLDQLMARGVGLVALHQAFTVKEKNAAPFSNWLGGVRVSPIDLTMETAPVKVASDHPVSRGITDFAYLDEFYPTIDFGNNAGNTPILTARVHTQYRGKDAVFTEPPVQKVVAWTHERAGGGRSFAYSGVHFLEAFDQPQVRTMILNAIMWTSGHDVPSGGVTTSLPALHRVVMPIKDVELLPQSWGMLKWFASREIGNSGHLTVGEATINKGQSNPAHWHPNSDEVLHLIQGHIMNRVGDKEYEMVAGDTVTIPEGIVHQARNIGDEDAIMIVSYNTADRISLGE